MKEYFYPVDNPKATCGFGTLGKAWRCGWHCGTDYSNLKNSLIYAISDGDIVGVNHLRGTSYGNHIEIRHTDGHSSLYAHLSSVYVKKGEGVKGGQVLGLMGSTGTSAKHLHIEVYKGVWRYPPQNSRPSMAAWYVDCHKFIGEKMEEGKTMTTQEAIHIVQEKAALDEQTMQFMMLYKYGEQLVLKLAKAIME